MYIFQPDRYLLSAFVVAHAEELQGDLLDIGGQHGERYRGFFAHVRSYKILDPDERCKPDIVASAERIPLEDASVDAILCMETLMYIPDLAVAIREIARILKPGGRLLASSSFLSVLCHEPHDYWRLTPFSLRVLLAPYFDDIRIERRGGYRSQKVQYWVRFLIERYSLYDRPFFGRIVSLLSTVRGRMAISRDARDSSKTNAKFGMGFNLLAKRRS